MNPEGTWGKASSSHCWTFCFLKSPPWEPHSHFNILLRRLMYSCSSGLATTAQDFHFQVLDYSTTKREILQKILWRETVFTMTWLNLRFDTRSSEDCISSEDRTMSCWKETRDQVPNNYLNKTGWIRSLFCSPHLLCIFIFKWTNLWTRLNYFLASKTYVKNYPS